MKKYWLCIYLLLAGMVISGQGVSLQPVHQPQAQLGSSSVRNKAKRFISHYHHILLLKLQIQRQVLLLSLLSVLYHLTHNSEVLCYKQYLHRIWKHNRYKFLHILAKMRREVYQAFLVPKVHLTKQLFGNTFTH